MDNLGSCVVEDVRVRSLIDVIQRGAACLLPIRLGRMCNPTVCFGALSKSVRVRRSISNRMGVWRDLRLARTRVL